MDAEEFRTQGREMVDYIASYLQNVNKRPPLHNVNPGYLRQLIPGEAPQKREGWDNVMKDVERVIMPGVTHWNSPHFHAYYLAGNSFPSILADMLSGAIGCAGFTWNACPASTELEVSMMDWLGQMLQLPKQFLFSEGEGGGVIQSSAGVSTTMAILSARSKMADKLKKNCPWITNGMIINKLVAYTSDAANSSVEKAGLIAFVTMRALPTDHSGSLRGDTLERAIKEDIKKGLTPFFCCATVGTTASCAFDNLEEIGPVCVEHDVWLHVDAAYAGSACICPEFRPLIDGVEHCTTFCFNPHKWLNVNLDCSALWVRKRSLLSEAFSLNPVYLKYPHQESAMPDFTHWQIPLSRRFRSLKLWFVIRSYGVNGLQKDIRKAVGQAKRFESHVRQDRRFEIAGQVVLGLVCFRLKATDEVNERLLDMINLDRRIHIVGANYKGRYILRFAVCAPRTKDADVDYAWAVIREVLAGLKEE